MEGAHFASVVGSLADGAVGGRKQFGVAGVAVAQRIEDRLRRAEGLLDALEMSGKNGPFRHEAEAHASLLLAHGPEWGAPQWRHAGLIGSGERGPENTVRHQREQRCVALADHGAALKG